MLNKDTLASLLKKPQNLAILDTETTGLDEDAQIIEISIIDGNGKVLMDQLVKPTTSIPAETSKIHGLYDKNVRNAPSFAEVAKQLEDIINGRVLIIWNSEYDLRLIKQSAQVHNIECNLTPSAIYCAQTAYAKFNGKRLSLVNAAAKHGIDHSNAHRALADVQTTLEILKVMTNEHV
ncbi:3'-5' exonuclease [Pseudomonas sp. F1_0610]|uniref:3'-5' exonuclease n=1 Tax=Pseudomonas sp. F1_0610 TaxID=3114284 RepID=UPI0039C04CD3